MNSQTARDLAGYSVILFPDKSRFKGYKSLKKLWRFLSRDQRIQLRKDIRNKRRVTNFFTLRRRKGLIYIDWSHLTPRSKLVKSKKNIKRKIKPNK